MVETQPEPWRTSLRKLKIVLIASVVLAVAVYLLARTDSALLLGVLVAAGGFLVVPALAIALVYLTILTVLQFLIPRQSLLPHILAHLAIAAILASLLTGTPQGRELLDLFDRPKISF